MVTGAKPLEELLGKAPKERPRTNRIIKDGLAACSHFLSIIFFAASPFARAEGRGICARIAISSALGSGSKEALMSVASHGHIHHLSDLH